MCVGIRERQHMCVRVGERACTREAAHGYVCVDGCACVCACGRACVCELSNTRCAYVRVYACMIYHTRQSSMM